jgi:hypothetical protein
MARLIRQPGWQGRDRRREFWVIHKRIDTSSVEQLQAPGIKILQAEQFTGALLQAEHFTIS